MSLRNKIALVLFLAVGLFVFADLALHRFHFIGRFRELDQARAVQSVERVVESLDRRASELGRSARELEDELSLLVRWGSREDAEDALPQDSYGEPLHLVVVYDADGWVRLQRMLDPHTREPSSLRQLPNQRLSPAHPLLHAWKDDGLQGWWITERGALLVSAHEVELPSGDLVRVAVGRFLDAKLLAGLRADSGLPVDVILVKGHSLAERHHQVLSEFAEMGHHVVDTLDDETLRAWSVVSDLGESPAFLVRVDVPRTMASLWSELSEYALTSTLAVALLFPLVILLLLQWIVTGPLSRLTSHAVAIGQANAPDRRLGLRRRDEIGQLASEFDAMLEKLARSRTEVVRNARLAGMSEIAAGVMHNIGNLLTSVTTSAATARRIVHDLSLEDLRVISTELERHAGALDDYLRDDPRGRHLLRFFEALVDKLEEAAADVRCELSEVGQGIDEIEVLMHTLKDTEAGVEMLEPVEMAELVDAAAELSVRSVRSDRLISIRRDYAALPTVLVDRHRMVEVLVNLVRNAVQALTAAEVEHCEMTLRLKREGDDELMLEVVDAGIGIARENLTRVFALGYSTSPEGGGLGLHLAANAASEMGGSLSGHSEGPGLGATFTLRLPLRLAFPATGNRSSQADGTESRAAPA